MKDIKVKLVAVHTAQSMDFDIKKEINSVQKYINDLNYELEENTVYFMFLKGFYDDFTKKMMAAVLFINNTGRTIKELHGVIRLKAVNQPIKIAKSTVDFDESFMGLVDNQEAVLVHINIPVKGLNENQEFNIKDLVSEFSDVRITYEGEQEE